MRDHAHKVAFPIHDRKAEKIVMTKELRNFKFVCIKGNGDKILFTHCVKNPCAGFGQHEIAQREHSHQFVHVVHHIDIIRHFLIFEFGADLQNGFVHGGIGIDQNDFRVHDACGGVRIKGQ